MILDLFTYFAAFPQKEGVLTMFSNGESQHPQYQALKEIIAHFPAESLIPEIESFVFGQAFETVKACVDKFTGIYLFVDFGEFSSDRDSRNSIHDSQKIAATVAMKISDTADLVEEAIASDLTLKLLTRLRKRIVNDSQCDTVPWLNRGRADRHDIIPFVSKEFKSIGWTIMFDTDASDLFNLKSI